MAGQTASFTPTGLSYARSITASTVASRQPTGLASFGPAQYLVDNSSASVLVCILFYNFAQTAADPTLTFPVDGAPPTGQRGTVILPGQSKIISVNESVDSFVAIGSAAGPTIIYVQRGEGL